MNRFFIIVILFLVIFQALVSCNSNSETNKQITTDIIKNPVSATGKTMEDVLPKITFDDTTHNFGAIIEGEIVEHTFVFTNTGGSKLVLTKVSAACGCTIPKYDTKPVKPGEKGKIIVSFNSENRKGNQNKVIKVLANTQPSLTKLNITANILY
ncbi:MAG: DUF1573 domain-containing protein [Bacteroidota bacterium]|nr:DUF1573 domain-containing protein [Bacteroidota bacterium]